MSAALLISAMKEKIQINPFSLSGTLSDVIDNGYGELIEDSRATPEEIIYENPVRVGYTKKWIKTRNEGTTPLYVEKRVYHMISDNETPVDIGLEFEYNGFDLKVMNRKELRKFNSLIGYEYEMKVLSQDE